MDVKKIQAELAKFAEDRDWEQFHSPKNLSMALAGEAGELLEIFQWLTEDQSSKGSLTSEQLNDAAEEIADIMIYALRLADRLEINVEAAILSKVEKNAARYTVEASRGNAQKR
jgi:NTP pyrophosphatase (non-canonical NTP hydrolase)